MLSTYVPFLATKINISRLNFTQKKFTILGSMYVHSFHIMRELIVTNHFRGGSRLTHTQFIWLIDE